MRLCTIPDAIDFRVADDQLLILAAILPFVGYCAFRIWYSGTTDLGYTISLFVSFLVLPAIIIGIFGSYLRYLDVTSAMRLFRFCVLIVALYGISLFFLYVATHQVFEIPYLTVNAGDAGTIDVAGNVKSNIRFFGLMKLVSTYQNGQIYGISMLLLLPLYEACRPSFSARSIVKFSLILTLSRTAWIGLCAYEVLKPLFATRIRLSSIIVSFGGVAILGVVILIAAQATAGDAGGVMSFLFDPNLGGRADLLGYLNHIELVPQARMEPLSEIVYLSVLHELGLAGLLLFMIAIGTPVVLALNRAWAPGSSAVVRASALAMFLYLIVCASDGAIQYIPVMAFFWFMAALSMNRAPMPAANSARHNHRYDSHH